MTAWDRGDDLRDLLSADPAVGLGDEELDACFSLARVAESAQAVFDRLADLKL
jgi:hypothetical protein